MPAICSAVVTAVWISMSCSNLAWSSNGKKRGRESFHACETTPDPFSALPFLRFSLASCFPPPFYLDLFGNNSSSLFTPSRSVGTILTDD
jgi:hypothetical protein